jgi:hypothetical protein
MLGCSYRIALSLFPDSDIAFGISADDLGSTRLVRNELHGCDLSLVPLQSGIDSFELVILSMSSCVRFPVQCQSYLCVPQRDVGTGAESEDTGGRACGTRGSPVDS